MDRKITKQYVLELCAKIENGISEFSVVEKINDESADELKKELDYIEFVRNNFKK